MGASCWVASWKIRSLYGSGDVNMLKLKSKEIYNFAVGRR